MPEVNLLTVCGAAFLTVFVLLFILAIVIRLTTLAFPPRDETDSAALIAAISGAVATVYPGARVTRIEEET